MAETAVGLFGHAEAAEAVVEALRVSGFPSSDIRVIGAPTGTTSVTPSDEFGSRFSSDLSAFGINSYESTAYLSGLNRGHVLVYATGTRAQAEEAVAIMDEYGAIEIDEFATASAGVSSKTPSDPSSDLGTINPESRLPESGITIGAHEKSYTSHASRSKKEGARIFSW